MTTVNVSGPGASQLTRLDLDSIDFKIMCWHLTPNS